MLGLAQPQLQKWARCSITVFPKMFTFREKLSQVSPVPDDYNVMPPPPITSPYLLPLFIIYGVATVYNKLTGGEGCWCVSIKALSLPGPSFAHVWSSVCLFWHLLSPLRFLGQAHVGHERWRPNKDLTAGY
jgi:hypothetical protein